LRINRFEDDPVDLPTRVLLSRLLRDYMRHHLRPIAAAVACMFLVSGTTIAFAKLIEPILDGVFEDRNESIIIPVALALVAIGVFRGLAVFGQNMLMSKASLSIIRDIQAEIFAHVMRADLAFFQTVATGRLQARISLDVGIIRGALANTLVVAGRDSFTLAGLVGLMLYQDWLMAVVGLLGLPVTGYGIYRIGARIRRLTREQQEARAKLMMMLDEAFRGARHVKSYGMEDHETWRARSQLKKIYRLGMKQVKTRAIIFPVVEAIVGFGLAGVVVYGGYQVIGGAKTTGEFFSFITALILAYEPIRRLTQFNAQLQNGLAAAQRVFAMLDTEPTIVDRPGAPALALDKGEIRFEDVRFSYVDDLPALEGISMTVPAGRTVALVGPSGAGKSTILNLIPRFYDVDTGAISIDGRDVRDVTLDSLRGSIGLVSQEISLFDDTVRANIGYGKPDAADDEIIAAAKRAGADDFIRELPAGYDTHVGGRGELLSGGQRQRIAIARAILKNAPILLLDEATSSLDTTSERQIQAALGKLMTGRTTLIIAHRLSTIVNADLIHVVDQGRIVESGTHAELLARDSHYAQLQSVQAEAAEGAEDGALSVTRAQA